MYFVCFGLIFVSFYLFVLFLKFFFLKERKNRKLCGNRGEKELEGFGEGARI